MLPLPPMGKILLNHLGLLGDLTTTPKAAVSFGNVVLRGGLRIVKKRSFFLLLLLCFVLLTGPSVGFAVLSLDLQEELGKLRPHEEVSVIVTFSDRIPSGDWSKMPKRDRRASLIKALREKADSTQRPFQAFLERRGVKRRISLWMINGMALTASREVIEELARFPGIEEIRREEVFAIPPTGHGLSDSAEWNLAMIRAPELWAMGYKGQGVVVANLDSGVDKSHPDLERRWRGGTNSWYDPYGEHESPHDPDGHGTMTMGILVGGSKGGTAIGVAPDAKWIAVKIFNDGGWAFESAVHQGFQWLLDPDGNPDTDDAPDVVNNSWGFENGTNQCFQNFQPDIEVLKAAGIAVVFSGGNDGPREATSVSPGNNVDAFAIGAVDQGRNVGWFSSRGPSPCDGRVYPDAVAPGVNVRSAVPGGSYKTASGTSFAAPHVAGAMALLLSAFPDLTPAQLEWSLKETAQDLGEEGPDHTYGHGLIDVLAAYQNLATSSVVVRTIPSRRAEDGWVKESAPLSGVGGRKGSSSVIVGEDKKGRRLRGILSFDTSEIPAGATIKSATLRLKRRSQSGFNPLVVQGPCQVDVIQGTFGRAKLEKSDFESPATREGVAVLTHVTVDNGYSIATFSNEGLDAINKGGITQVRLSCTNPPSDKALRGFMKFYGGEKRPSENSPTLEVVYMP